MPRLPRFAPLLVLAVLIAALRSHAAQNEPALSDPVAAKLDQRVTRFLNQIAAGDESDAFAELLLGSQLLQQEPAVRTLVERSKEIDERYGAHRGSEQIGVKRIGKDLVLVKYLFKCEKFPVIWYFAFYRDFSRQTNGADDHWVVVSVRFDTLVEALFD